MIDISLEDALLFVQVPHRFIHTILRDITLPQEVHLNKTHVRTLLMLRDHGPISMHRLGKRVGMSKGSFTQVIDGLVREGLVKRYRDPQDRRSVLVAVTSSGISVVKKLDKNFLSHLMPFLALLSESERQDTIDAIKKLRRITEIFEERMYATK